MNNALRWLCMQAFGLPVVPDVYGMITRSSGAADIGAGDCARAIASCRRNHPAERGDSLDCITQAGKA